MSKLFSNFYLSKYNPTKLEKDRTNRITQATTPLSGPFRPNDIGFRLVLIPTFGIVIPLVTGMINPENFSHWQIKFSFLYSIAIAMIVWEGNRYLHFTLRSYFDWYKKPLRKIAILLITIIFYTVPASVLLLVGWYHLFQPGPVDWDVIFTSSLLIMICVIFITHVYETVFLVKESENEIIRSEQLEKARAVAALEALKNQIDPHFIFNSLNTLSHLIDERPQKAKLFNDNLAGVYRYILLHKSRDLVLLRDELDFLQDYFSLLKIRFEDALQLRVDLPEDTLDHFFIPPISLQVLLENAVKHNEFSDSSPLLVSVVLEGNVLYIRNSIKRKFLRKKSSLIGLHNLTERYRLTTNFAPEFIDDGKEFMAKLPLLKTD